MVEYGIDNESAWTVGLSCGGQLQVLIQPFPEDVGDALLDTIEQGEAVTWIATLEDGQVSNELGGAFSASNAMILEEDGPRTRVTQHIPRAATILIIGGADIAVHLVKMADQLGFETILIDPRAVFTGSERFPVAPTQMHTAWPQEIIPTLTLDARMYAVLLTHDPKIDDPAIALLFESDIAYIGALGGRNTQEKRRNRLRDQGHSQENIDRIVGPVGLKIGAATPAEIALSILGQIVEVQNTPG